MRIIPISKNSSWDDQLEVFLLDLKKNDLSSQTIKAYQNDLNAFRAWIMGINPDKYLAVLTEIDLIEYRQHLITLNLKPATINRHTSSIQKLCRWAVTKGILASDITKSIKQVNISSKHRPSGLKVNEVNRLLQAAGQSSHGHAKRNYALIHLMLQTGLRVNEVASLKLDDVEVGQRSGMVHIKFSKGQKSRDIPLNSKARRALLLYLAERSTIDTQNQSFFLSERQTPLSSRGIQATINNLSKKAGLTRIKVSPHTLRHTFAITYLKQHPTNIVELATLMGHESLDTTAIYTQPSLEDLADNLELMGTSDA